MLSKLFSSPLASKLWNAGPLRRVNQTIKPNTIINKRWSGHNVMDITPSRFDMKYVLNWMHFYLVIGAVPTVVISTLVTLRANPELSEVPDGYEPRHWEYYKNPITRFFARYFFTPDEFDRELFMALHQNSSETYIMRDIVRNVELVMQFYNDHRTLYFIPFFGEYVRGNRDEAGFITMMEHTDYNEMLDKAFEPGVDLVPIEGYRDSHPPPKKYF